MQFDDGVIRECAANILRIERLSAFLPAVHMGVTDIDLSQQEPQVHFAALFLHLTFHDWKESLKKFNCKLSQSNEESPASQRVALFQQHEFIVGLALMIAAAFSE